MADKITRPSVSLLPMDDIEAKLDQVFRRKDDDPEIEDIIQEFLGAEPEGIALAQEDRNTVLNAKKLGNQPPENYMLRQQAQEISQDTHGEIIGLRSELYALKNELAKKGFLSLGSALSGFYDPFRSDNILYDPKSLGPVTEPISSTDTEISVSEDYIDDMEVGDFVAISGNSRQIVRQIDSKGTESIELCDTIGASMEEAEIKRNTGRYYLGTYSFSEDGGEGPSGQEQFSTLDDESNKSSMKIDGSIQGLAYTFTVSDSLVDEDYRGYLSKLKVRARTVGSPGSIRCYILKEEDMDSFNHKENNNALGVSSPVNLSSADYETITFDFQDAGSFPEIVARKEDNKKQVFCVLLVAENIGSEDYWQVLTLKGSDPQTGGLHRNNVLYLYPEPGEFHTDDEINIADLWYRVGIRAHVKKDLDLHTEGLYTANFSTNEPCSAARVSMKINKEGRFQAEETGFIDKGQRINYIPAVGGFSFDIDHKVVIGGQTRSVENAGVGYIELTEPVYIENPDVYPVNYYVYLLARRKVFDPDSNGYVYEDENRIELPLKDAIPSPHAAQGQSAQLVFERELDGFYNDFQLQIAWYSPATSGMMEERPELGGQIFELTATLNKTPEGA